MITCADIAAVAPDLALGTLSGEERADALAHLDSCRRCREIVDEIASTVDVVASLAPPADPPAGFEERVLARLEDEGVRRARRVPRRLLAAAAVLVAGVLFAGGALWLRHSGSSADTSDAVAVFTMQTPSGRTVGEAYLHRGDSTWVFVDVPGWAHGNTGSASEYSLRVTTDDGQSVSVPADFAGGGGGWGTEIAVQGAHVRELALVDHSGHVWCYAAVPA
jgi:hypothetical protein